MHSLRQLTYAVAVDEQRHFGRAAQACHISQPALSSQIAALERTLGVTLFQRVPQGAVTTTEGAAILTQARRVLHEVDVLRRMSANERDVRGPFHLGVIPTMAPYLLPRVLEVVRRMLPDASPWLHEDRTTTLVTELLAGGVDVALLALPVDEGDLVTHTLGTEPFDLVVPSNHPLARGRRAVPASILSDLPVLLLEDGHCLRDQTIEVCGLAGASTVANVRAASLPTLLQMVAAGHGVTLLPRSAQRVELRPGVGVVTRPFTHPSPGRTVALAWRRTSPRDEVYRALAQELSEAFAIW